jgi:hypothetical protein
MEQGKVQEKLIQKVMQIQLFAMINLKINMSMIQEKSFSNQENQQV